MKVKDEVGGMGGRDLWLGSEESRRVENKAVSKSALRNP